jgi:hypothetical protein
MYNARKEGRIRRLLIALFLTVVLIAPCSALLAQSKKKNSRKSQPALNSQMAQAKADLVAAAKDYKDSLQKLLVFQEADVITATETLEKRRVLLEQNIIGSTEVEESKRALFSAKARVKDTTRKLAEAELFFKTASSEANDYSRIKAPYQREVLLRVLRLNALPMREVEEAVKTRGVGFRLTPEDEATFSSLGAPRELLRIIASNYRTL